MNCVLVTGAGKGIGYSCVERISKSKNTKVIALIKSKKDLKKFDKFKNVFLISGNVNSSVTIKKIFNFAKKKKIYNQWFSQ